MRGRALLESMYDAAVAGAAPGPLTAAALRSIRAFPSRDVRILALGKAAPAMCAAAVDVVLREGGGLPDAPMPEAAGTPGYGMSAPSGRLSGLIVAPALPPSPHPAVTSVAGDHPMPGPRSFAAARRLGEECARVRRDDLVVVLLSGGASSLIAAPLDGLAEEDLLRLFALLHRSGLDIHAMNAVRKRFTRWGAGRLAVALAPARMHVLVVSDVPGDELADVASGPCAADPLTARDVRELLHGAGLLSELPVSLRAHLDAVERGAAAETPKQEHPAFSCVVARVIGSNRLAVEAAVARGRALGIPAVAAAEPLAGDAARAGVEIAQTLLARAERGERGCMVWGGETTVRLAPRAAGAAALPATGGRCQELALAAAGRLASGGEAARRVMLLAAGTDGRDGPTDAAGAFADAATWSAIARGGRDPARALARHESHAALDAAGALLRCGLTGTNVMDVVVGAVE